MSEAQPTEVAAAEIACARHPERAATAVCYDCEVPICDQCLIRDSDGLALCPRCSGEASSVPVTPTRATITPQEAVDAYKAQLQQGDQPPAIPSSVPWERPESTPDIAAFLSTTLMALTHPVRFMTAASVHQKDLITPTLFGLSAAILGQAAITSQVFFSPQPIPLPSVIAAQMGGVSVKALMLALLPVLPICIAGALLTKAVLAHLILGFFNRRAGPFESTLRIFAYAEVASVLLFFPAFGVYAEKFLAVFLVMTGLRVAHRATLGASLAALFPLLFFQMLQL